MKKPTKSQQQILDKMNDGFELTFRSSHLYPFRFARLTKNIFTEPDNLGIQEVREISEDINLKSFDSLISNGFIIEDPRYKNTHKNKIYILKNEQNTNG